MTPRKINIALVGCICGKTDCGIPYGLCHCGCGGRTKLATCNRAARGWIKGQPHRFIKFHNRAQWGEIDGNTYQVGEVLFRRIPLTQGQYALVSPHRYDYLMKRKWCAVWCKGTRSFYASCFENGRVVKMHRLILGLDVGDSPTGDHKESGDTLNNTDENLRFADRREQQYNKRKPSHNTSGYKGVSFHKKSGRWMAVIRVDGKQIYLGLFNTPELAYAAYCAAAIQHHREFACLV
jgi:hypothetical protein